MEPHGFTALGGLDKTIDNRDISLGAITSPTYTFAASTWNTVAWASAVEYQAQQPACGAHSGAKINGLAYNSRFTPRYQWANIKSFDGLPLDAGTDMRSIFKSLKNSGSLDFVLMGNDATLDEQTYAHPVITQLMTLNAGTHVAPGYGFASDLSFNGIKQYINDHGAIILLVEVGKEWWTAPSGVNSWQEADILPLRPPATIVSGHFVVAHSYDEKYIYFINSWSNTWGRAGHGYFGVNYMPSVRDAGTLIHLLFDKDLSFGMTDPEVKDLQVLLNKTSATQISATGPGSPGQETSYFGQLTKNAVMKFQSLHSISPVSGYVGPLTRAVLNTLV